MIKCIFLPFSSSHLLPCFLNFTYTYSYGVLGCIGNRRLAVSDRNIHGIDWNCDTETMNNFGQDPGSHFLRAKF